MKCISMIFTLNCSELCNIKLLSNNLVFQVPKAKNFRMANAACVTSYRMPIDGRFLGGKFEKEILLQFPPNEVYFYDINMKLLGIV